MEYVITDRPIRKEVKIGDRIWVYYCMLRFYGENEYIEDFYEVVRIFKDVKTKEISLTMEKVTNNPYKERFTILADDLQIYNNRLIYSNIIDFSLWK